MAILLNMNVYFYGNWASCQDAHKNVPLATHCHMSDQRNHHWLLQQWRGSGRQLIGCFAAASNISGIMTDTDTMTVLLHKYGALAFWDYATAAPYMPIDMNPVSA